MFQKVRRVFGWSGGVGAVLLLAQCAAAQTAYTFPPLSESAFKSIAIQGFGDRQNTWAWSMAWFQNRLYVGTNRSYQCIQSRASNMVDPVDYPYPPTDPAISCTPDPNDLMLQAEIWVYDPAYTKWARVFQSPQDVPIPGSSKFVARDIGFRGMLVYTESDGSQALYIGGCSSNEIHPGVPGGRMLRTTDGLKFTAIPQDPGTLMGNLNNACFRGMLQNNGQMFAMATNYKGEGTVVQSANPSAGDNAWQQISSPVTQAYEIAFYNNFLYVTFVSKDIGFSVAKTTPVGPLPYTYQTIIPNGGYAAVPNPIALSMATYDGYLYVGGDGVRTGQPGITIAQQAAELFRIHADDTWDLVAGLSRNTPIGRKNSLSGLGGGFDWDFNEHLWRMNIFDSRLYVTTFDESTGVRYNPTYAATVANELGFDMWWTQDGTYFTQVEQDGMGDKFNIGGRTMANGPYPCFGMFLGTANSYYGLKIYEGIPQGSSCGTGAGATKTPAVISSAAGPEPPQHVQVEGGRPGALLSWDPAPSGTNAKYHVFRRSYQVVPVDDADVSNPDYVPTMSRTARQDIGTTDKLVFEDRSALPGKKYAYEIMTEDAESGSLSGPSNFVTFPAAAPPVTFTDVRNAFNTSVEGHKFTSLQGKDEMMNMLDRAELEANRGQFGSLRTLWSNIKNNSTAYVADRDTARTLELSLSRLTKRAQLVEAGHLTTADVVPHTEAPPTPPAQPTTGPAGTGYPNSGVTVNGPYWANNRYTIDDVQYYIYEPLHPAPATAPVILFLHGYGALTTDYYQAWINHMVMKGFIVVWPKYQATILSTFANFPSNAQSAWTDALYRLQNFTWEHHVKPTLNPDGSVQAIFVGHSFGGWISAWLAGQASTAVPSFAAPEAVVMIEPASLGLLPPINYAGISPSLKMLIVSADQDTIACSKDGVSIYTSTPQVPASQKNYLFFNTDSHGAPALLGNHYFPTTNGYNDDAAIDARDFFVTYKLSVAAATCVTVGNNCGYFLGNGSTNQTGMGAWSDGTAAKPMSYYADPTTLPHIVGCAP